MAKRQVKSTVPAERIEQSILMIRGHKVLLDADLAQFYGVETKYLVRAMKRNVERFPDDFMFQLTGDEWAALRCQIGTLSLRCQIGTSKPEGRGGRRTLPYAFTEQGVAMLSSVLRSQRAVQANIEIMRAFVRLRQLLAVNAELARRLDELEGRVGAHDEQFVHVIRAIRQLMEPPAAAPRPRIGFHKKDQEQPSRETTPPPKQHGAASGPLQRRRKKRDPRGGDA